MNQTARIEMWTAVAQEAASIAKAFADPSTRFTPALGVRMACVRGQVRGWDANRLPFPAWDEAKAFRFRLDGLLDASAELEARLQHGAELIDVAGRLVEILATSAHRPRADLDD